MQNPVCLSKDNINSCILQGILLPKLIPYAQQCGRDYLVQEDGLGLTPISIKGKSTSLQRSFDSSSLAIPPI